MDRVGVYVRVSSKSQDTRAQETDLEPFRKQLKRKGAKVTEYVDRFTGRTMHRPGWDRLWADVLTGKIDKVVVWRLDRLGRTVSGLSKLFEDLIERQVSLVSLRDGLDLSTPAGRLMAHVLASVAAYETEVRCERQQAGIEATKKEIKAGKRRWFLNGPPKRSARKLLAPVVRSIRAMGARRIPIATIARQLGLSRNSVYVALGRWPGRDRSEE